MNELSLTAVNSSAPYDVSQAGEGCYQFFTSHGVHCSIEFVLDDSLMTLVSWSSGISLISQSVFLATTLLKNQCLG